MTKLDYCIHCPKQPRNQSPSVRLSTSSQAMMTSSSSMSSKTQDCSQQSTTTQLGAPRRLPKTPTPSPTNAKCVFLDPSFSPALISLLFPDRCSIYFEKGKFEGQFCGCRSTLIQVPRGRPREGERSTSRVRVPRMQSVLRRSHGWNGGSSTTMASFSSLLFSTIFSGYDHSRRAQKALAKMRTASLSVHGARHSTRLLGRRFPFAIEEGEGQRH